MSNNYHNVNQSFENLNLDHNNPNRNNHKLGTVKIKTSTRQIIE